MAAAKKKPTKAQLKEARAKLKKARVMMIAARKVLGVNARMLKPRRRIRRHRLRPMSPKLRAFNTWQHDLDTLLPAVLRASGADLWTSEEFAGHAAAAADRMRAELDSRLPHGANRTPKNGPDYDAAWYQWEQVFDDYVHQLVRTAQLDANAVIDRAIFLTDARFAIVKQRRTKLRLPEKRA